MLPDRLPTLAELSNFVNDHLAKVLDGAEIFRFSRKAAAEGAILAEIPRFIELDTGYGVRRWVVALFVDLRKSTERTVQLGPRDTYISMHCLLATLAHLVSRAGGHVANFRGDGLFGVFGLDEHGDNFTDDDAGTVIQRAVRCGRGMIEAIDDVICPAMRKLEIDDDIRIGVGIDHGDVVITRIGLAGSANELTVYGPAVNNAAKRCGGNGEIVITEKCYNLFPKSKGGRVTFKPVHFPNPKAGDKPKGYSALYPSDMLILERPRC